MSLLLVIFISLRNIKTANVSRVKFYVYYQSEKGASHHVLSIVHTTNQCLVGMHKSMGHHNMEMHITLSQYTVADEHLHGMLIIYHYLYKLHNLQIVLGYKNSY